MTEPFHLIFAQAAAHGLRLNNLCQNSKGEFIANWRRDNATPDGQSVFANICTSTDAFHALKDSLAAAVRMIPLAAAVRMIPAPAAPKNAGLDAMGLTATVEEADLFG